MKYLCLIFVFHLSLLSWQFGQDFTAENVSCSPAEAHQLNLHNDSNPDETEDCADFCLCEEFESAELDDNLTLSVKNRFVVFVEKTVENSYRKRYSRKYLDSIWQPPKIDFTA